MEALVLQPLYFLGKRMEGFSIDPSFECNGDLAVSYRPGTGGGGFTHIRTLYPGALEPFDLAGLTPSTDYQLRVTPSAWGAVTVDFILNSKEDIGAVILPTTVTCDGQCTLPGAWQASGIGPGEASKALTLHFQGVEPEFRSVPSLSCLLRLCIALLAVLLLLSCCLAFCPPCSSVYVGW
jgi:hypothetical protein